MKTLITFSLICHLILVNELFGQTDSITHAKISINNEEHINRYDTIKFDAIVIDELDSNWISMLKWHKKVTKHKHRLRKNDIFIINIFPIIHSIYLPKEIIDSMYKKNRFPITANLEYQIVVNTIDKRSVNMYRDDYKFYSVFEQRDVFICSHLNIEIDNINNNKTFTYVIDENISDDKQITWFSYSNYSIFQIQLFNIER